MKILWIAGCAFLGGIVAAILGWIDSGEPFVTRKFLSSVIRALFAGFVFGVTYTFVDSSGIMDFVFAFLSGAGIDAIGNRIKIPG